MERIQPTEVERERRDKKVDCFLFYSKLRKSRLEPKIKTKEGPEGVHISGPNKGL